MDYLQKILDTSLKNKYLFGLSLAVDRDGEEWSGGSGNLGTHDAFFIASTTKLFTSALIFRLRASGKLGLQDRLTDYLSENILRGLHHYKGEDYSNQITLSDLLAHTSGIPDYFQSRLGKELSLESLLTKGQDIQWDFLQAINWSKQMKPSFIPSQLGKARYSDTNFQLLGKLIETLYEEEYKTVVEKEICQPLGLSQTYVYADITDQRPKNLYYKTKPLHIPKAMTSFGPDGGIVSTSNELMIFLKAFMKGKLFPSSYLEEISHWNKIFFPLEAGIGIHRFKSPWYFSPFTKIPELIGHSGLSGAFAYFSPEKNMYLTGTVNQIYQPGNSYRLLIKVLMALMKKSTP